MAKTRCVALFALVALCSCSSGSRVENIESVSSAAHSELPQGFGELVQCGRLNKQHFIGLVRIKSVEERQEIYFTTYDHIQGSPNVYVGGRLAKFEVLRTYDGVAPPHFVEVSCMHLRDQQGNAIGPQSPDCPVPEDWTNVGNPGDLLLVFFSNSSGDPDVFEGGSEIRRLAVTLDQGPGGYAVDLPPLNAPSASLARVEAEIAALLSEPARTASTGSDGSRDGGPPERGLPDKGR